VTTAAHGRLATPGAAPAEGEHTVAVAMADGFRVEQILSGRLAEPHDYAQDHDEWVVVLAGGAVLVAGGIEHHLAVGDWFLLPAGAPHRLVRTEPGTSWLAIRSAGVGAHA
jgi:cupin 2 domain-containing protein